MWYLQNFSLKLENSITNKVKPNKAVPEPAMVLETMRNTNVTSQINLSVLVYRWVVYDRMMQNGDSV